MLIVDRLEGDWAVIEWRGGTFNLPRCLLPEDVREGDVLELSVRRDLESSARRRELARKTLDDLFGG